MILQAQQIRKEFIRESRETNCFQAVQETNLTLSGGTLNILMGRSGSGKSTLLNMLAGLLEPTSGKILLDGTDLYGLPDKELSRLRNQKIGVIPQGQTALHSLNVLENILLPCTLYGETVENSAVMELLERLEIAGLQTAMPSELSGGELRRMAIARALIRKPDILLADEPTSDLDDVNTAVVFDILKQFASEGKAVFVVTHENDAGKYADRLFHMDGGILRTEDESGNC